MRTALLALLVTGALPGAAQEMLTNPTLAPNADATAPEGWRFQDFRTGGRPVYSATGGRDGGPAAGIACDTPEQRGAWYQIVPLQGRRMLHLSGWYRTGGVSGGAFDMLRMTWLAATDRWDFISDTRARLEPSEHWREFSEVFMAPEGAVGVAVELFNFFRPGTVWWSEAHLRECTDEEVRTTMAEALEREPAADEVNYEPAEGEVTSVNPPPFVWLPVKGAQRYIVQYAPGGRFDGPDCVTVEGVEMTVFTPTEVLAPGQWAWRYGFAGDAGPILSRARSFTIPADAQPFPRPRIEEVMARIPQVHPRVYFTADGLEALRAKMRDDPGWAAEAGPTIRSAEQKIGEALYPEPDFLPEGGQERSKAYLESFRTMRPFTSGMETCACAWVLTGDERFGQEARRRLLHFMSWDPEGPTSVSANDEAAMDIAMRAPRTYDWIHELLSEDERALCRDVLGRRLAQINALHRRMPFDSRPYSSHPGRMIGFMVEGSIVFAHEIPEAREWLDYTLRLMYSVYPAWGNPDGGWSEGPGYWGAYIGMLLPVTMLLDGLGVPYKDLPFLSNTGWFGLYAVPVGGQMTPFGDGHEGAVGRGYGSLLYRLSTLYRNPYWRWYAEQLKTGPGGGAGQFLAYDPTLDAASPADLPQARVFPAVGIAAMHSNLAAPAENVYLLMRSSPYGAVSHAHASQNAIAIQAYGEALAISSGYYQRYGSPHHAQWTWETKAHCSVLVDGQGQVTRNPLSRGRIVAFDNQDEFCYAVGDATAAYGGRLKRFLRRVLFLRPALFVICDELEATGASSYQWLLHAKSEMALDEPAGRVTISQGQARLVTTLLAPAGLKFSQFEGFPVAPEKADSPTQYHFTADTVAKSATTTFVSVLAACRAGEEAKIPAAELVESEGGWAVRLTRADGETTVLWRQTGAEAVTAGDITSRAEVSVIARAADGALTSVYAYGAGEVSVGGRPLR